MTRIYQIISTIAVAALATSADATVSFGSSDFGFTTIPSGAVLIDFDAALPAGFSLSGGLVRTADDGLGAEPAIAPGTKETSFYLSANANDPATLTSLQGYRAVSLYWGSMDTYNTLELLDQGGTAFASLTGGQVHPPANGLQFDASTNRRVNITSSVGTSAIYGLRFKSTQPAFEVDNIAFSSAVPEPATWAMTIAGIGLTGGAIRRRRRARSGIAFA